VDTSDSRSEITRKFENIVQERDGEEYTKNK
jgi:hypothetical protein